VLRRMEPRESPAPVLPSVPPSPPRTLRFAGWQLDTAARRLLDPQGQEVVLTGGEFDLLSALAAHSGRVLSRDFLLESTRGREAGPFDRTIDVQIGRLRRKLEVNPASPQFIKSVRGAGYLFAPEVEAR
jgi:two-component system OmpR family response regulator